MTKKGAASCQEMIDPRQEAGASLLVHDGHAEFAGWNRP